LATDYGADLLLALAESAARQHDVEWTTALSRHLLAWSGPEEAAIYAHQALSQLLSAIPTAQREPILLQILSDLGSSQLDLMIVLLDALDAEWGAEITQRVFALLEERVRKETQTYSYARNMLVAWGRHADVPAARAALSRLLGDCAERSPWRGALETLNDVIEFRAAMRQELST
jgi:hypothetical protein